jgi:hypothetical protein
MLPSDRPHVHTHPAPNGQEEPEPFPTAENAPKSRPLTFLVPGLLLQRAVNVLQGGKGAGKSLFYTWAAAIYLGAQPTPPGAAKPERKGRVLLATEEPYADHAFPRFKALGVKPGSIAWAGKADGSAAAKFHLPDAYDRIEHAIRRQHVGLVIVDTFTHFLQRTFSPNEETHVRQTLDPAVRLGEEHDVTFVFTQHLTKDKKGAAIEHGRGSGALPEIARSVAQFARPDPRSFAGLVSNVGGQTGDDGRVWSYRLEQLGGVRAFVLGEELHVGQGVDMQALEEAAERSWFDVCVEFLREELKNGPRDSADMHRMARNQLGCAERTMDKAAKHLGVVFKRHGTGKDHRSTWELPKP